MKIKTKMELFVHTKERKNKCKGKNNNKIANFFKRSIFLLLLHMYIILHIYIYMYIFLYISLV